MANRAFKQMLNSLVERLSYIQCRADIGASGATSNLQGGGVKSLTRTAAGTYKLVLDDSYNRLMGFNVGFSPALGSTVNDGSFSSGTAYAISTLGTQTFTSGALTISSGTATLTVDGMAMTVAYNTSATVTCALLAAACSGLATNVGSAASPIWQVGVVVSGTAYVAVVTPPVVNGADDPTALVNVVSVVASSTHIVVTSSNPNPPVAHTVAVSASTGSWAAASLSGQTTIPATDWHSVGVPADVVPAVGVVFVATGAGNGTGTDGVAKPPGTTSIMLTGEVMASPNACLKSGSAPQLVLVVRKHDGTVVDPDSGSVMYVELRLRNSSIKGKGE